MPSHRAPSGPSSPGEPHFSSASADPVQRSGSDVGSTASAPQPAASPSRNRASSSAGGTSGLKSPRLNRTMTTSPNPGSDVNRKAPEGAGPSSSGKPVERIFPIRSMVSAAGRDKDSSGGGRGGQPGVKETDFAAPGRRRYSGQSGGGPLSPRAEEGSDSYSFFGGGSAPRSVAASDGLYSPTAPLASPRFEIPQTPFSTSTTSPNPATRGLSLGNLRGLRSFPSGGGPQTEQRPEQRSPRSPLRLSAVEEGVSPRQVEPVLSSSSPSGGGYFSSMHGRQVYRSGPENLSPAGTSPSADSLSPAAHLSTGPNPTPDSSSTIPSRHQGGPDNTADQRTRGVAYSGSAASEADILARAVHTGLKGDLNEDLPGGGSERSPSRPARDFKEGILTERFEHVMTADGHMVVTGRKDQIRRCEDEPIHIPGAVQAFGVLIAVIVQGELRDPPPSTSSADEAALSKPTTPRTGGDSTSDSDHDTGSTDSPAEAPIIDITAVEVVQCSENSGHLLGLPPKLLLGLNSLTDVFDKEQAAVLRDNIEVVFESSLDYAQTGPHTFRIEGEGELGTGLDGPNKPNKWACWCAAHRPDPVRRPRLVVIEFELENDTINPPCTDPIEPITDDERGGLAGEPYEPTEDDLKESTKAYTRPLRALARLRRKGRDFSGDSVDVIQILAQINEQFDKALDLSSFLKMVVSVVRELTGFHRVMVYQFDENWNGLVVAELVDWKKTRDLYRGLHFPATDIPVQARELYKVNKVRMLFDRDQPTARLVCKDREELEHPLDMTHGHLRAMSPIHIKYLANMGVRASFSISIISEDRLWGLISCHSYGRYGHRVTFPTRHFCRMLGASISRTVDRLTLAQRLSSRKLINTTSTSKNPSGYIVAKAEDLLWLFDAEFGVLSIGDEAKILGPLSNSQEVLVVLEYLRIKNFDSMQATTDVSQTFPDIAAPGFFKTISGLLVIPLSRQGRDFICFFRQGQLKHIHWAGNPYQKLLKEGTSYDLEPRKSFKLWSETVMGKSKPWTEEQIETAGVLCLVYGKFIDVWRQKEAALQTNQLQALLLSNASHEVRTPLNAIINYLEMALEGQLDQDTRDNLSKSYNASRALVHVINDLLDLTRTEQGNELFSKDPFSFPSAIEDAVAVHRREAERKGIEFTISNDPDVPPTVLGDRARIRQVIGNLVANAVKHTERGHIAVHWAVSPDEVEQPANTLRRLEEQVRIAVTVTDTGVGIAEEKLEGIFRAFEQVDAGSAEGDDRSEDKHLGLGLAVVGRVVHTLGGQLRVESEVGKGSKFTAIFPFDLPVSKTVSRRGSRDSVTSAAGEVSSEEVASGNVRHIVRRVNSMGSAHSGGSQRSEIEGLVEAISTSHMGPPQATTRRRAPSASSHEEGSRSSHASHGQTPVVRSALRSPRADVAVSGETTPPAGPLTPPPPRSPRPTHVSEFHRSPAARQLAEERMRILVAEDDNINRMIIKKKLTQMGHDVVLTVHGQDAVDTFKQDPAFDIVLMDLQMPHLDGWGATRSIRQLEDEGGVRGSPLPKSHDVCGRIPILAVSASLRERQRGELEDVGMDGWILKPIDFARLGTLMRAALHPSVRSQNIYEAGQFEKGGWLSHAPARVASPISPRTSQHRLP